MKVDGECWSETERHAKRLVLLGFFARAAAGWLRIRIRTLKFPIQIGRLWLQSQLEYEIAQRRIWRALYANLHSYLDHHCLEKIRVRKIARFGGLFECFAPENRTVKRPLKGWRRERDSNPRYGFPYTRFPSVRLQPLGHLSSATCDAFTRPRRRPIPDSAKPQKKSRPAIACG